MCVNAILKNLETQMWAIRKERHEENPAEAIALEAWKERKQLAENRGESFSEPMPKSEELKAVIDRQDIDYATAKFKDYSNIVSTLLHAIADICTADNAINILNHPKHDD